MVKRARTASVPCLQASTTSFDDFRKVFTRYQVVLVKKCLPGAGLDKPSSNRRTRWRPVTLNTLRRFYRRFPAVVCRTFTVESGGSVSSRHNAPEVLGKACAPAGPWYASFIVQRHRAAFSAFLQDLPMAAPPFLPASKNSNAAWVFFGQNPLARPLRGRPEHTDAIAHSGTWHLQLQGSKVWTLRPTAELQAAARKLSRLRVRCTAGDVLCLNTRLWRHSTHIPGRCSFSLSVARDMYLDVIRPAACNMTNIKGHYATQDISRGAIIFTEDDAPYLQLPRSKAANCELAEDPDGRMVVVAKRKIVSGDWFSLSESEDEDAQGKARKRASS